MNEDAMSMIDCQEALSTARGDHRDPPEVSAHLSACQVCRGSVSEIRTVAAAARAALAMAPSPDARFAFERARAKSEMSPWLLRYAFATAATAAAIAVLVLTKPSPSADPAVAAKPKPSFVLEFPPPEGDRFHYVVHGPAGSRNDVVVPQRHYVLETAPPNAVVVVDTF